MTMNFKAENKAALLDTLQSIDVKGPLLDGSRRKENTEPYAMAHLLSSLAERGSRLTFPLELTHRKPPHDKPDFLLSMGGKKIGIEHTDARPENETRKDVLRRKEEIGPSVCFLAPAEPGEPRRSAKQLKAEIEANDSGVGWGDQDNTDRKWSDVMLSVINAKQEKLQTPEFSRYDEDWLLIRDAWPFPSVDLQNATGHLFSQIRARTIELEFDRVFIISSSDRGPLCEIGENGFTLHPRNDLWL
ncbi:MAG: hypothetical protein A2Z25_21685 [Planctomycetes bacterium RBG_16_55_9]|nr:MAG: hypothetical protein A2Z25_21685 [Planctomycetes bacterium RBG_16_55_9]